MNKNVLPFKILLLIPTLFFFTLNTNSQSINKSVVDTRAIPEITQNVLRNTNSIHYISVPDGAYTSNTTSADISGLINGNTYFSVMGGGVTLDFDNPLLKGTVPGPVSGGTITEWNTPPAVESATPDFLDTRYNTTIDFSEPLSVFGFEARPFDGNHTFTITFYNGSSVCTTITKTVNWNGALLFAAQANNSQLFTSVTIESTHPLGFEIANIRFSKAPYIGVNYTAPKIDQELADISICRGSSHTFKIAATGENLKYQWYKGNFPILGNLGNKNELTISNATEHDYDLYYVVVENEGGSAISNKARLWVVEPLPENMKLTQYPNPAISGIKYPVEVEGRIDIKKYSWSYSLGGATFQPLSEDNKATVVFSNMSAGNGTISVNLEHICGNRTVKQNIQVKYPTGTETIAESKIWVGPNPVTSELNIESGNLKIESVVVTDASGRNIYQVSPNTPNLRINATNWSKGIYLVKVTTVLAGENNSKVYKMIKN